MKKAKILIVDNNLVFLEMLSNILEGAGYHCRVATDGLEAIDQLPLYQPDMVITDLVMPRMDGGQLCRIIRHKVEYKKIFLMVLSCTLAEDRQEVDRFHADVWVAKGPILQMKKHILETITGWEEGSWKTQPRVKGLEYIQSREITKELLSLKHHSEIIFKQMNEGMLELDRAGRIIRINHSGLAFFSEPEEQLLTKKLQAYLDEKSRKQLKAWLDVLERRGEHLPLQFDYQRPALLNGTWITLNLMCIKGADEIFISGLFQDIGPQKEEEQYRLQLSEEVARVQKTEALATMAGGITHDFNNLLSVVSGNIELARALAGGENVVALLKEASAAVGMTTELVQRFTAFADSYLPAKSSVEPASLLRKLVEQDFSNVNVVFQYRVDEALWPIDVDEQRFIQVFRGIFCNAIEANKGHGVILVEFRNVEGTAAWQESGHVLEKGRYIEIRVSDQGPGMPAEMLEKVFDPYFTTKEKGAEKGMGLGLSVAQAFVCKHGGRMWLTSGGETSGCTAHLYLPAGTWTEAVIRPLGEEGSRHQADQKAIRVLLMDDDEMVRVMSDKLFNYLGCEIVLTDHGEETVKSYQKGMVAGKPYDLVVVDLRIKNGVGGAETCRRILDLDADAKILVSSGDRSDVIFCNYQQYGFWGCLPKPYTLALIRGYLKQLES